VDFISRSVAQSVAHLNPVAVIVPTLTGHTARMVSRFRLPVWTVGVSPDEATCQGLQFSYGVQPVLAPQRPGDWSAYAAHWAQSEGLEAGFVVLTEGPSQSSPQANPRLEVFELSGTPDPPDGP
jgi:pyruvate kinase